MHAVGALRVPAIPEGDLSWIPIHILVKTCPVWLCVSQLIREVLEFIYLTFSKAAEGAAAHADVLKEMPCGRSYLLTLPVKGNLQLKVQ